MSISIETRANILRRQWRAEDVAGETRHALEALTDAPIERRQHLAELIHAGRAMDAGILIVAIVAESFARDSFQQATEEAQDAADAEVDRRIEAARFAMAGLAA